MPYLQLHMRRVAAVGELILSAESDASKDDVVAALLLHDLGNIVKFRLGG
jgi:predicted HD phosphohydrolase